MGGDDCGYLFDCLDTVLEDSRIYYGVQHSAYLIWITEVCVSMLLMGQLPTLSERLKKAYVYSKFAASIVIFSAGVSLATFLRFPCPESCGSLCKAATPGYLYPFVLIMAGICIFLRTYMRGSAMTRTATAREILQPSVRITEKKPGMSIGEDLINATESSVDDDDDGSEPDVAMVMT
ncbi:expressed unknown protein [Seminavis robusta]|uniref:Uncharacterized protein n=1 Tax=Seminavis robusta TaxID=568900 RepID=A0A9N8HAH3_9STRA|nr:expressed unknown protein [Seminavis robusta]|eukprot:Sro225_g091750.1 n/a (178) ;mRNA; f:28042-28575